MNLTRKLVLASQSPRRRKLLALTGIAFETFPVEIDETFKETLTPEENVMELSRRKAATVAGRLNGSAIVLSADTTVLLDHVPLGKPHDFDHAFTMLANLQGRTHEVLTGFTLLCGGTCMTECVRTLVEFETMSGEEITVYLRTMEPYDKAGSYGIQDPLLSCFVRRIDGCYYNVVGLPLSRVYAGLKTFSTL
jgi:septum formation protein